MSWPARALLFLVRVYQSFFSALMPSACKFYPSCSHYAADALRVHGARRGSWLALKRVARCHPFTRGGVDLVPDAEPDTQEFPREFAHEFNAPSFCHSERSEESLSSRTQPQERFLAALGMTKGDAGSRNLGVTEGDGHSSGLRQAEVCATRIDATGARS